VSPQLAAEFEGRLPGGAVYRWEFEKHSEQVLVDVSDRLTLDESGLIREAALAGYGLAYMSEWDVADDLRDGRLVQLLADWTPSFLGFSSLSCSRHLQSFCRWKCELRSSLRERRN
jgi:DNA-binding transcriptional LysR family regulator